MASRREFLTFLAAALPVAACKPQQTSQGPSFQQKSASGAREYSFAIHPLHNPQLLFANYNPVIDYLNSNMTGVHFHLVASRDYAAFEQRLGQGDFDFALPNPYQTLLAAKSGYRIFGKAGANKDFYGIILTRKDSGIERLSDLRGQPIAYPAPTAMAATLMPQYFLTTHGVPVTAATAVYVGSQESSIRSVQSGVVVAAATWPIPWRGYLREKPEVAELLDVRWKTPPLVNNGLVVHDRVPRDVADHVSHLLFGLGRAPEGRAILDRISTSRFEPATDATYAPVKLFLKEFEERVRPIST